MGIALIASASCTQDKVMETSHGKPIDFRAAIETKGVELTTDGLTSFRATAIDSNNDLYFQDLDFTKNGDIFTSTPEYYWPASGELTFYAYSPADKAENVSITPDAQTLDFTPEASIADQIDLVAIKVTGSNTAGGMAIEFQHSLTQIQIDAKNTNTGYTYSVTGVKLVNIASEGTFNFTNWDVTNAALTTYSTTYDNPIILDTEAESIMGPDGNAILIPQQLTAWDKNGPASATEQTGSYLAVRINVKTSSGVQIYPKEGESDWVAVSINTEWLPGYKYIYILDFTTGAGTDEDTNESILGKDIKFELDSVTGWSSSSYS